MGLTIIERGCLEDHAKKASFDVMDQFKFGGDDGHDGHDDLAGDFKKGHVFSCLGTKCNHSARGLPGFYQFLVISIASCVMLDNRFY